VYSLAELKSFLLHVAKLTFLLTTHTLVEVTYCSFLHQNYHHNHFGCHISSDLEYSCCFCTGIHEAHKFFYL